MDPFTKRIWFVLWISTNLTEDVFPHPAPYLLIPIKHGRGSLSCPWWWDHSFTKTAGCWMNRRKISWVVSPFSLQKSRDILWSFLALSNQTAWIFTDVENEYVFLNRTMFPLEARESSEKLKRFQVLDPNCWPYWDDTSDTLFSSVGIQWCLS